MGPFDPVCATCVPGSVSSLLAKRSWEEPAAAMNKKSDDMNGLEAIEKVATRTSWCRLTDSLIV